MTKFNFKIYKNTATRNAELAFDKMSKRVAPSPFFNDTDNLQQDSNLHKLNVDYQCMFLNVQPITLDDLIKELVSKEVISRTTISGLYIVNHNIFFNGDKTKFIKEYKGLYGDKPVFKDNRGRVVLTGSSIEKEIRREKEEMSNR